jgi:chromosome segregation ATPase
MTIAVLPAIITVEAAAAVLSLLAGLAANLVSSQLKSRREEESHSDKLKRLTQTLTTTSVEFEEHLREMTELAHSREGAVRELEVRMTSLQAREQSLKTQIDTLQNTPIEVAEYFAKLTSAGESRSARRDYILFGLGVIVSTLIGVILHALGYT